jgi:hypothetical protein
MAKFIRAQASATRCLSSPRACCVSDSRGHHARALRAAGDQYAQTSVREVGIGPGGGLDHRGTNRIAGVAHPGAHRFRRALQCRKTGRNDADARGEKAIGAPHHRILLVQQGRQLQQRGGQ